MSNIISPEQLIPLLGDKNLIICDCRFDLANPGAGKDLYSKSHIPGSVYVSLDDNLSAPVSEHGGRHPLPSVDTMAEFFGSIGIERNITRVVAYDDSNNGYTARLWWMLRYLGHENVQVLDGGFTGYFNAGGTVNDKPPAFEPKTFVPQVNSGLIISMEKIRNMQDRSNLVDCRAAVRYNGEQETIDPKAGHIPGAVNLPWAKNFNEKGGFLSIGTLKNRFSDLKENPVMYCGSGVTACVNILTYEEAGLGTARLYAGSWSDWISYPENEIEQEKANQ